MPLNLPKGFYAQTLRLAYPVTRQYFIQLYPKAPESLADTPCEGVERKMLTGYRVEESDGMASLHFDEVIDWMNVTVKARGAIIFDEDENVLSLLDFGRDVGVVGGLMTVRLSKRGVVGFGDSVAPNTDGVPA